MEPSLQTNLPPAQWETPPLLPLHGVLAASAAFENVNAISKTRIARIIFHPLEKRQP